MRTFAAMAASLVLGSSTAARAAEPAPAKTQPLMGFAATLPALSLPIEGWEVTQGSFESAGVKGAYMLYVNPRRPALFQLIRYRLGFVAPATDRERQREATERVVFNADPDRHAPLQAWVRTAGEPVDWRVLVHGTDEYREEMGFVIRVLQQQNADALTPRGESKNP